jgi:hypothetical protein
MGYGGYSYSGRTTRAKTAGWDKKPAAKIFKQRKLNNEMNPNGIDMRESRDSDDHPESIPIILALDVTGSMGGIPHFLVKEGLPNMMDKIIKGGVPDPQVLFMGIGDHECDKAPLQVGQFESGDELLDKWLTALWIEGGGGGNDGESYLLAWMFANKFTSTDHFEKREKKGLLFTVGDEHTLKTVPEKVQREIMGTGQYTETTAAELLDGARQRYDVYHLHLLQGHNGSRQDVKDGWKQLMGDHAIFIQNREQVAQVVADKVIEVVASQPASPVDEEVAMANFKLHKS